MPTSTRPTGTPSSVSRPERTRTGVQGPLVLWRRPSANVNGVGGWSAAPGGLLRIRDDTASMDTPAGQIRDGIVNLIECIPLGHQCIQVELAPFIPPNKGGEIAVRATQAPACASVGTLSNAEFLHINAP